jgi:putative RNA 2'-phosphotransferase
MNDAPSTDDQAATSAGSKRLSWLLRHGANEAGLSMDAAGFVELDALLEHAALSRGQLERIIAENNKARFEVRGSRVRAVQGHSLTGTPVTLEGLEATWEQVRDDTLLVHGTHVDAARAILSGDGIHPAARTHVHLAASAEAKVGKRHQVAVLLEVAPAQLREAGLGVFRAPNGVLLTRRVPRAAIVGVSAQTKAGKRALDELRQLLLAG